VASQFVGRYSLLHYSLVLTNAIYNVLGSNSVFQGERQNSDLYVNQLIGGNTADVRVKEIKTVAKGNEFLP
jgi:hypothetical protein